MKCETCGGHREAGQNCLPCVEAERDRYKVALKKMAFCNCKKVNGLTLEGHEDWCNLIFVHETLNPKSEKQP